MAGKKGCGHEGKESKGYEAKEERMMTGKRPFGSKNAGKKPKRK